MIQEIYGRKIRQDIKLPEDIEIEIEPDGIYINHVPIECLLEDTKSPGAASAALKEILNRIDKQAEIKHLKGYIYDSLVYRYKNAREKLAIYEDIEKRKAGKPPRDYQEDAQRDILRFCQILTEAIGEHD